MSATVELPSARDIVSPSYTLYVAMCKELNEEREKKIQHRTFRFSVFGKGYIPQEQFPRNFQVANFTRK